MPKAKYEGIYHSIKKRIEAQDYPYQSLLPSENTLIEEYACSRNTVRRALAELVADGYVQTMQGRGVRVIYQPVGKTTFTIGGIETFQETARRNHLQAVTRVIRFETITATEQFAAESGFSEGDELWAVQRVRYLDGKALFWTSTTFKGVCTRDSQRKSPQTLSTIILRTHWVCRSSPASATSRWNTQLPVMKSYWIWTAMTA